MQLTDRDWKEINDLILQMNCEQDILRALQIFLVEIDKLIPYEKATTYFYSFTKNKLYVDKYIGQGFEQNELAEYENYYFAIDDIIEKMLPTKLNTIRSSDVFDISQREKTEYYFDYIRPVKTHFSLDSNFKWNKNDKENCFGSLDLFRSEKSKDFTDREVAICKILQPHLEIKASQYVFSFVDSLQSILDGFCLTKAENEVARLVLRGYSNDQIALQNFISISTVKKHVANILNKSKSCSRVEFICKVNLFGKENYE